MVTARISGPCASAARHRAAMTSRAVESGPPDTASTTEGTLTRSASSSAASPSATAAASAMSTLLFPVDALLHVHRGARILATDFAQSGTSQLLLAERRERL